MLTTTLSRPNLSCHTSFHPPPLPGGGATALHQSVEEVRSGYADVDEEYGDGEVLCRCVVWVD